MKFQDLPPEQLEKLLSDLQKVFGTKFVEKIKAKMDEPQPAQG